MGPRGEGWVILQLIVGAAILLATPFGRVNFGGAEQVVGVALIVLGGAFGVLGIIGLGSNLTPFPKPKDNGQLVTQGIYGIVRHPIYAGLFFGALGWSIYWGTLPGIVLSLLLFVVFDLKSRREEEWLREKYAGYRDYQNRVKKLIPFVY